MLKNNSHFVLLNSFGILKKLIFPIFVVENTH